MAKKIFIHGWATDSRVWDGVARGLCNGEEEAIMPDLPGHGSSSRWLEPSLNPALAALSRLIRAEEAPLAGLGWSLGAKVLLSLAASMPGKFSALVLVGATPSFVRRRDFSHGQPRALVRRMIMDMKKDPQETLKRFYPLNFTEEEGKTRGAVSFLSRYAPPGPVVCDRGPACRQAFNYRDMAIALEALYNADLRRLIHAIDVPTLIVHGKADKVVPLGAGEFLAENMKNAEIEVFPSAGHAPFITEEKRFIEVTKDFLGDGAG